MKLNNLILKQALYNKALDAETAKQDGQERKAARLWKDTKELLKLLQDAAYEAEGVDEYERIEELADAVNDGRLEAIRRAARKERPYYVVDEATGELEERIGNREAFRHAVEEKGMLVTYDAEAARRYADGTRRFIAANF